MRTDTPPTAADSAPFLRNCWYVAAFSDELAGALLARRILDEPVVFLRTERGAVAALEDRCPHRLVPLSIGKQIGDAIQCGYHGAVVGADGSCLSIPGQKHVPDASRTRSYPALERHGLIWIWTGNPQLADSALVPDVRWLDHPQWASAQGYVHFATDYRLINDNLLDLSHETYIHQSTIGNAESESIADFPVEVTTEAHRRVFARREMPDVEAPPQFAAALDVKGRIDRLQIASYTPPGVHLTEAGLREPGTSEDFRLLHRVTHLLTPETKHSTHYFFALSRSFQLASAELTEMYRSSVYEAFYQDKYVLELQQKSLLERGDERVPRMPIALDGAAIIGRRILTEAIARETADRDFVAPSLTLVEELSEPRRRTRETSATSR